MAIKGPGMTPDELQVIKTRWGLDGSSVDAYVDFAQARRDIAILVREIEREWNIPWKMQDARAPRA